MAKRATPTERPAGPTDEDVLENAVTGDRIRFLERAADTDGERLRVELEIPPGSPGSVDHVKPRQTERFEVRSGTLTVVVDGDERTLSADESLTVAAGVGHAWRNDGDEPATVVVTVRPALRTGEALETLFALGRDGRTNQRGVPSPLQLAVLFEEYEDHTYLAGVPVPLQKVAVALVAPIARRLGYTARYPAHDGE